MRISRRALLAAAAAVTATKVEPILFWSQIPLKAEICNYHGSLALRIAGHPQDVFQFWKTHTEMYDPVAIEQAPEDWLESVRRCTEMSFLHLKAIGQATPAEAKREFLSMYDNYVETGRLTSPWLMIAGRQIGKSLTVSRWVKNLYVTVELLKQSRAVIDRSDNVPELS